MLNLSTLISALLVLVVGLCFLSNVEALPRNIAIERRDGDFDNILSELKSKGSRMRFGKRSAKQEIGLEDPNLYLPDRFVSQPYHNHDSTINHNHSHLRSGYSNFTYSTNAAKFVQSLSSRMPSPITSERCQSVKIVF